MADTGAPWNLPYPLPTDLVRDGADAIKDLAEAVAPNLTAGIGANVVSVTKTDFFSASVASAAAVDIDDLEVTITPTTDTSKVLVMFDVVGSSATASIQGMLAVRVLRGTTPVGVGTVASRAPVSSGTVIISSNNSDQFVSVAGSFIDEPNVDTPVTYKLQLVGVISATATYNVNRAQNSNTFNPTGASTLTVIEVAP